MSTLATPPRATPTADHARRLRRCAWWSLALLPLSFVAGVLLGGFLLAAQGIDTGGEELAPALQAVLAGVPALIVIIAPAVLATWLGVQARRQGDTRGGLPALLGTLVATTVVLQNAGSYVLGRLLE